MSQRAGSAFVDGDGVSVSREMRESLCPGVWGQALATTPIRMKQDPGERVQGSLYPRRLKLAYVKRAVNQTAVTLYSFMIFQLKTPCTLTELYRNNPAPSNQHKTHTHNSFARLIRFLGYSKLEKLMFTLKACTICYL